MDETQARELLGMVWGTAIGAFAPIRPAWGRTIGIANTSGLFFLARIMFLLFGWGGYCAHEQGSCRLVVQRVIPDFVRVRYEKESGFVFGFLD